MVFSHLEAAWARLRLKLQLRLDKEKAMFGTSSDLLRLAEELAPTARQLRESLHQIPELRWEEEETLEFIRKYVASCSARNPTTVWDFSTRPFQYTGGLVIDARFNESAKRIGLRADVDGLLITEETGLPFASRNKGKMHACGHDFHAAWLLTALEAAMSGKVKPVHNLRFVFQRAEENPITESGGARLVKEGVCEGVSQFTGLHIGATGEKGKLFSRPGRMMANSDRVRIQIACRGGHVAAPERNSNAIDIMTDIHVALRGLAVRHLGALEPCSLVPAISNSGTASNVRPGTGEIWYANRQFLDDEKRLAFEAKIDSVVRGLVAQYPDASVELEFVHGHPALFNDESAFETVRANLLEAGLSVDDVDPILGGEDFAHYGRACPSSYWLLGAAQDGVGENSPDHHEATFNPADVHKEGVAFWLAVMTGQLR